MEIKDVKFIKGVTGGDYGRLPQIAFLGRSNVGKSSLINSLVGRKKIAQTSKIPGKTREANFYLVNNDFYLVDFPGYGYAKASIKERDKILKRIIWYLAEEEPLAVFLVVDAYVGLTLLDKEMMDFLSEHNFHIIANKADKGREQSGAINYSTKTGQGREEVLKIIKDLVYG